MNPILIIGIMMVESGFDNAAIGDKGLPAEAYGPMQIRLPVCEDVNRKYGTNFEPQNMLNQRDVSIAVFCLYVAIYATEAHIGRAPTDEDRARIWNGGPNGWNEPSTIGYWQKVSLAMGGPNVK